jgi:hypothetical protein
LQVLTKGQPLSEDTQFYFCVDETTSRRHLLLETLQEDPQLAKYDATWLIRALDCCNKDINKVTTWLRQNAPTPKSI